MKNIFINLEETLDSLNIVETLELLESEFIYIKSGKNGIKTGLTLEQWTVEYKKTLYNGLVSVGVFPDEVLKKAKDLIEDKGHLCYSVFYEKIIDKECINIIDFRFHDIETIHENILTQHKEFLFICNSHHWSCSFDWSIKDIFYSGDQLLSLPTKPTHQDIIDVFEKMSAKGHSECFPHLLNTIQSFMGKGNYIYDGHSIGEKTFEFFFDISKTSYPSFIKKFKEWINYLDIAHMVTFKHIKTK